MIYFFRLSLNLLVAALLFFAFNLEMVSAAFKCSTSMTPPLVVKGKRFYDSSNDRYFPIKGIAYYPRPNDGPLIEGNSVDFYTDEYSERWTEDIRNMRDLGVNAVRLYAIDPSKNHDNFMCALQEVGIYVMLGLLADCEDCGIGAWVGKDAEPPLCYTSTVKDRGRFVIRSFSKYDNLMAFSAGNEVSIYADDGQGGPREANVPCQKKFLRDMREYASGCTSGSDNAVLSRTVPIGLVNWDGNAQLFEQHVYYHCRTDPDDLMENTEWFALNSYRHCDGTATSPDDIIGWPELKNDFEEANFQGPVLFGEYGCREYGFPTIDGFEAQRTWYQAEALYTQEYSDVFAGGFVFEYSTEKKEVDVNLQFMADRFNDGVPTSEFPYEIFAKKNYGIGYFSPADCQHDDGSSDDSMTPCEYVKYPEWKGLMNAYAIPGARNVRAQRSGEIPDCPDRFQPLSSYDWPTDEEDDPELEYCLELKRNEILATESPTEFDPDTPDTRSPTTSPDADTSASATDSPTTSPSESISKSVPTLSPTVTPTAKSFVPTILIDPDLTTISPSLSSTLTPSFIPTMLPAAIPTSPPSSTPTMTPNSSPTLFPTLPPTLPPSMPPTLSSSETPTLSKTMSPSVIQPSTPTFSPTAKATEAQSAQCSSHSKCEGLGGLCCPTVDGVMLGCCDVVEEKDETEGDETDKDEDALESSAPGVFHHRFVAFSVFSVLFNYL